MTGFTQIIMKFHDSDYYLIDWIHNTHLECKVFDIHLVYCGIKKQVTWFFLG